MNGCLFVCLFTQDLEGKASSGSSALRFESIPKNLVETSCQKSHIWSLKAKTDSLLSWRHPHLKILVKSPKRWSRWRIRMRNKIWFFLIPSCLYVHRKQERGQKEMIEERKRERESWCHVSSIKRSRTNTFWFWTVLALTPTLTFEANLTFN